MTDSKAPSGSINQNTQATADDGRFDFPENIYRVTGGNGGENYLIVGSEKTALYDAGMPFNGEKLVRNIKAVLGDRPLDYCLVTHSHFDHAGGVPYLRQAWPDLEVVGSEYAAYVFTRESALRRMKELAEVSSAAFGGEDACAVTVDGLAITKPVQDGETISLGEETIVCMEAKGHTKCSMMFALEPQHYLFACESTGVMSGIGENEPAILTSYEDAMAASARGRAYQAKRIFSPHYGIAPADYIDGYWDAFENAANDERAFIESMYAEGLSEAQMLERFTERYWSEERGQEQSYEAFSINALATFHLYAPQEA